MVAGVPCQGGAAWAMLQYVLGLRRLGHDVYLVEPVAGIALQPSSADLAASCNAAYFRNVMEQFDLQEHAALLQEGSQETVGLPYARLMDIAQHADLLINVSGMLSDDALLAPIPVRAYLDLDPAFIQIWHHQEGIDMHFGGHTHFVTVGQAIGDPGCPVPMCGLSWITTRQPVVLDHWPVAPVSHRDELTTVGNWRGYGSVEYHGIQYGQKAHSLRQFIDIPTRTSETFALALSIHPDEVRDVEALNKHGWRLLDPLQVADTPDRYRDFIQGSKAEFGIAKSGYVASRCGWFSDRSVCYLASGRPVIAQETGFSRYLPTGHGLHAFEGQDDILSAIDTLNRSYASNAAAAREIAGAYFDSDLVLTRLLDRLTATA